MTAKRLSPLAELVLRAHRVDPRDPYYALDVLGTGYRRTELEKLKQAYEELEEAGMVERSGQIVRFFGDYLPLYVLPEGAEKVGAAP